MRKYILTVAGLAVAVAVVMRLATKTAGPRSATAAGESAVSATNSIETAATRGLVVTEQKSKTSNEVSSVPSPGNPDSIAFASDIDTLVSPHSTYSEKQAAWKELLSSGRIRDAIAELEQRAANDPKDAQIAAALGQAYLKACGTTTDVHDQAIWAMQADRSFDAALQNDPENWDARFTKAVAMSYWPANLNKGQEVIDQFNTLIQQQEKQAPQPQFAQAYDWLGQQYAKAGQQDLAQQTWQRGLSLYPENQGLQGRSASPPAAQQ